MRVLTIDVDYITTDYARFTEQYFHDYPFKRWDKLITNTSCHPCDFKIDSSNLIYIIEVFTRSIEFCDNVVFGKDHESILYELESSKEKIELVNIDQHHDISYKHENMEDCDQYGIVDEGCWVWYLYQKNLIDSYKWIKTETSVPYNKLPPITGLKRNFEYNYEDAYLPNFDCPFVEGLKTDFPDWDNFEFDLIYVAESLQYVFPEHWFYSDILKVIYKNKYKKYPKQINYRYKYTTMS